MASRVWRLKLGPIGENCYIAQSGGTTAIIDPGAQPELIVSFLRDTSLEPSIIVLTHGHLDHSAAIPDLFVMLGTSLPIAVHPKDAVYLGDAGEATNRALFDAIHAPSYFQAYWKPLPPPSVLLEEGMTLSGTTLRVIHTPGHSAGSICLYEAELETGSYGYEDAVADGTASPSCLITGDTLFRDGVGRTDGPDADPVALERSLRKLAHYPPATLVFPGHGPRTTVGRELPPALRDSLQ